MLQLVEGGLGNVQTSPAVAKMQEALVGLAQASGKPMINPGQPTGYVGPTTVNAVIAAMGLLTVHLGPAGGALTAGLAAFSIFDQPRAAALIRDNAARLEQAARAAAIAVARGQQSPDTTVPPPVLVAPTPWYKTWWGVGAIAVTGVGLLALLASPRRAEVKA